MSGESNYKGNLISEKQNETSHLSVVMRGSGDKAIQLKDNRPQTVLQKKQLDAMADKPIQKKSNNTGLPDNLKSGIENLSGYSMDDVKVHYNSSKPAQLNAYAYAQGTDIHVASGQEKHLAHEAWHVVQQKQGRVKPTMQMKGKININDNVALEREADVMGGRALQMKSAGFGDHRNNIATRSVHNGIVQRLTNINFNPANVNGASVPVSVNHNRVGGVHGYASGRAQALGAFNNAAGGAIQGGAHCNHSRSYNLISNALMGQLAGQNLAASAGILAGHYNALYPGVAALGAHVATLNSLAAPAAPAVPIATANAAFDYYTYKISDYPSNLFYWPDRTGANPDLPGTDYIPQPPAVIGPGGVPAAIPPAPAGQAYLPAPWAFGGAPAAGTWRAAERARVTAAVAGLTARGL